MPSSSVSPSRSPSSSVSPSIPPSDYSRGSSASLPATDADLSTLYSAQDYIDVDAKDNIRVSQNATTGNYALHEFKDYADTPPGKNECMIEWYGQIDISATLSAAYLQIYNYNTNSWENLDQNSTVPANTNFSLTGSVPDLTNYKNGSTYTACRVYLYSIAVFTVGVSVIGGTDPIS